MSSACRRPRVGARAGPLCGLRCDLLKLVLRDPVIAEALEAAEPGELLDACGSVGDTQRGRERRERVGHDGLVETQRGREAERVHGAVRDAVPATERLRHGVREEEPALGERHAGMHRALEQPRSPLEIAAILGDDGKPRADQSRSDGRVVTRPGVERLRAVGERVHRRPDGLVAGKVQA